MSHCYSVAVNIDGESREVCTSHVPGNEHVQKALDAGKHYDLTKEDVKRAVDYHLKGSHKIKEPYVESPQVEDMEEKDARKK